MSKCVKVYNVQRLVIFPNEVNKNEIRMMEFAVDLSAFIKVQGEKRLIRRNCAKEKEVLRDDV